MKTVLFTIIMMVSFTQDSKAGVKDFFTQKSKAGLDFLFGGFLEETSDVENAGSLGDPSLDGFLRHAPNSWVRLTSVPYGLSDVRLKVLRLSALLGICTRRYHLP